MIALLSLLGAIAWFYYDYRSNDDYVYEQRAEQYGVRNYYQEGRFLRDAVELEPRYKAVCSEVDAKVDQAIKLKFGDTISMGKGYAA